MINKKYGLEIGGKQLEIEARRLAEQANADVLAKCGGTEILATAVMSREDVDKGDFFPLTVDYEERYYAAGKILGPRYIKRESRPSDEAIANARIIDRSIRPLFPSFLGREVQVIITVLSWDGENDPDVIGIVAASAALSISDIPWQGPLAALRVGKVNGGYVVNPTYKQREESRFNVVFSSTLKKDEVLINMIEGNFDEQSEEDLSRAFAFAKKDLQKLIEFQKNIQKEIGKEKAALKIPGKDEKLENTLKEFLGERLEKAIFQKNKSDRNEDTSALRSELLELAREKHGEDKLKYAAKFFDREIEALLQKNIIGKELRPDGRKLDELRPLDCEVGLLPRTHGSGLFTRGQTKSLSILTLGAPGDRQILEGMEIVGKKRFMHHYNFPPYSSGEIKPMRGPGRREIGHGMLAEKALLPLIPSFDDFPYTIRIVSEILSSNGSSSMAAASSSSLALMDAGVPIRRPASGIALGLVADGRGNYKILTDIQGPEDHYGDMDFKIAGTAEGITAIQMDVKIMGISETIMQEALARGKKARLEVLGKMQKVIDRPRPALSPFAPRILTIQINPDKIREVIGPGGKVINEIIDECGVQIDIEDSGKIFITAESAEAGQKALAWIENITREVKVGEIFQGKVRRILNFGAFVEILPNQEGLVHISQLAPYRVAKVEDIVKIGQIVPVKVISIDEQGRINLSLKETQNQNNKK